jgi:hypothetical protein
MNEVIGAIALVGIFLALVALMPDFDGWSDGDWDDRPGKGKRR